MPLRRVFVNGTAVNTVQKTGVQRPEQHQMPAFIHIGAWNKRVPRPQPDGGHTGLTATVWDAVVAHQVLKLVVGLANEVRYTCSIRWDMDSHVEDTVSKSEGEQVVCWRWWWLKIKMMRLPDA